MRGGVSLQPRQLRDGAEGGNVRVEILFAVSAATALAVEVAERCNLTLVGFAARAGRRFTPIRAADRRIKISQFFE